MLDIGWTEIAIIAVIGLLVVGPKDMPGLVRTAGRWSGRARKYARDFQRNFESIAEENELSEIRKEIEAANRELAKAGQDLNEPSRSKEVTAPPSADVAPSAASDGGPDATTVPRKN